MELHNEEASELEEADEFVQLMWVHFDNLAHRIEAKSQIVALKQIGRPPKELIMEFRRLAEKLRDWPE